MGRDIPTAAGRIGRASGMASGERATLVHAESQNTD
jgi:hypothetical protein